MTRTETISWVFLSIAFASKSSPVDYNGISRVADGINHAIPTYQEMQTSIKWLIERNLVKKTARKYSLSDQGNRLINEAQSDTKSLMNIWKNLEIRISEFEKI